ncbi:MAG: O-antigen ligase family protein [Candidatus Aminicenantes bacterium]|nr:O-antigen ligase family protein [Candidatus Aminicenantes bacterium]
MQIKEKSFASVLLSSVLIFIFILFLIYFYYVYVPLLPAFQKVLVPCLSVVFLLTIIKVEWGLLGFIFLFPLINFLPYIFRIYEDIPHAPTSLVLFLFFLLGWGIKRIFSKEKKLLASHPLYPILIIYLLIILISGLITFHRYGSFFPFLTDNFHELVVNIEGVRAGGARMSTLFSSLNLVCGLLFSLILWPFFKQKNFKRKATTVLLISFLISLFYGFFQFVTSSTWARLPRWVLLKQIQATYKDPNAFAFFLAAFIPLLTAGFTTQKRWRLPLALIIGLSFICLLGSGTRSAFLASVTGIIFFLFFSIKILNWSVKKRIILILSILLIIFGLLVSVYFLSSFTLVKRLNQSWINLTTGAINQLFSHKTMLWKAALAMFKDYPLTGVGIGAYIVELPNYLQEKKIGFAPNDSAENVIFQLLAEVGLLGLIISLALFFQYFKQFRKSWSIISGKKEKIMSIGLSASLIACLINFAFHSYIGSYEAKFLFWFLATLFLVGWRESPSSEPEKDLELSRKERGKSNKITPIKKLKLAKIGVIAFLLLFLLVHLFNSLTSLSIPERASRLGWPQDFGFYQWEKDWRGGNFRWAKKEAGLSLPLIGPGAVLSFHASHPDLEKNPLKIRIFLANRWFRKKEEIYSFELRDRGWHPIEIKLIEESVWDRKEEGEEIRKRNGKTVEKIKELSLVERAGFKEKFSKEKRPSQVINLRFEASRAWKPKEILKIHDARELAFALSDFWYRYFPPVDEKSLELVKTIPPSEWVSSQGLILASYGSAELSLKIEQDCFVRLQLRGQKAFNLGPLLNIYLDGQLVVKTLLESEDDEYVYLPFLLVSGQHKIKVEFTNDFYSPSLGQDRNLYLGQVELLKIKK